MRLPCATRFFAGMALERNGECAARFWAMTVWRIAAVYAEPMPPEQITTARLQKSAPRVESSGLVVTGLHWLL